MGAAARLPRAARGRARCRARSGPPERATLLSRDGKVLAEGPADARSSPLVGDRGLDRRQHGARGDARRSATRSTRAASRATGRSGRAGSRRPSRTRWPGGRAASCSPAGACWRARGPRPAPPVRTTIDTRLQEAAVIALAGRFGGIAALDPRNGEIRALAGIAFSAPQPPGSTFKIVTTTAALEAGSSSRATSSRSRRRRPSTAWSSRTPTASPAAAASADSFAHSCNSVFAPLGREGRRRAARRRGRALRLERGAHDPGRGGQHAAAGRRRSRRRSRSARRRSARARCWPLRCGWPRWRRRSPPTGCATSPRSRRRARAGVRVTSPAGGAHDRVADGRRRGLRHRHGRRDRRA